MKYFHLPKAEDTAVENVDFKLFTSDNCNLEGEQTGGCVSFAPGQIHAGLTVEILADTIQEGNETFHLKIEYARNGRRSDDLSLSTLKVTIIDAAARKLSVVIRYVVITCLLFSVLHRVS